MNADDAISTASGPKYWHPQQEKILKGWGESAACYRYLHYKSYSMYKRMSLRFTLPIIIIGTITGTANFAQDTFPENLREYVPAGIGALNLFGAILTTIQQFLKVNELMESHRVSYIHYGKLARSIRLELALPVEERQHDGASMVNMCRSEYDRLIEQSPPISTSIILRFEKRFPDPAVEKHAKGKGFKFVRPEIMSIKPIEMYDWEREKFASKNVIEHFRAKTSPHSIKSNTEADEDDIELADTLLSLRVPPPSPVSSNELAAAEVSVSLEDGIDLKNQV